VEKFVCRREPAVDMDPPLSFTEKDELVLPVALQNFTAEKIAGVLAFKVEGARITGVEGKDTESQTGTGANQKSALFEKSFSLNSMESVDYGIKVRITGKEKVVLKAWTDAGEYSDGLKITVPVTPYGVEKVNTVTALMSSTETRKALPFKVPKEAVERFYRGKIYIHTGVYRAVLSSLNYLAAY
ncbi:MAG: hypothetical protein GY765_15825, partial [bacterium]|nr:hypothetical protein [bacterium]